MNCLPDLLFAIFPTDEILKIDPLLSMASQVQLSNYDISESDYDCDEIEYVGTITRKLIGDNAPEVVSDIVGKANKYQKKLFGRN